MLPGRRSLVSQWRLPSWTASAVPGRPLVPIRVAFCCRVALFQESRSPILTSEAVLLLCPSADLPFPPGLLMQHLHSALVCAGDWGRPGICVQVYTPAVFTLSSLAASSELTA